MRILAACVCMSLIGAVATVLAAVSVLIQMLPVIVILLAIFAGLRWCTGRQGGSVGAQRNADRPAVTSLTVPSRPSGPRPDAWLLVPVWTSSATAPAHRNYIDAEVIDEDNHHG